MSRLLKMVLVGLAAIALLISAALFERHQAENAAVAQLKAATTGAADPKLAP